MCVFNLQHWVMSPSRSIFAPRSHGSLKRFSNTNNTNNTNITCRCCWPYTKLKDAFGLKNTYTVYAPKQTMPSSLTWRESCSPRGGCCDLQWSCELNSTRYPHISTAKKTKRFCWTVMIGVQNLAIHPWKLKWHWKIAIFSIIHLQMVDVPLSS